MKTSYISIEKFAITGNAMILSWFLLIMHIKNTIMTSNEILKADVLDILFDNRNKQYGAYTLRKNYNSRLGIALGISLSTILFVFFLVKINERESLW